MANNKTLKFLLHLQDKAFKKQLNGIKKQLQGFKNFIKGAFALGSITAFGKQMVQLGTDFEDAMARVKAVSNATVSDFKAMQKEAQKMGETTRYTASEAASALEMLTRNGMSAREATSSLSAVLQLAQANAIELAQAADILTNTMNMFGLKVSDAARINDVLSSTAANSATDVGLLYEALVNAAPAANVLGFTLEETSAAIGALAQKGVKGADAGTQLRMSLSKMADPKIIAKMQAMGVAIDEQTMKEEGLLKTVKRLKDANLSLSDLVAIFSQKGAMGMQQLISAYDDFNRMVGVTASASGTVARMFQQGVGTVRGELDTLKSAYEGLLISISQKTEGVVVGVIRLLQNLIGNFKTVGGTLMNIASVVVPLVATNFKNMARTVMIAFGKIQAGALATKIAIGNIIGVVATLVTWVGTALVGAWNRQNQAMRDAAKGMKEASAESSRLKSATKSLLDELQPEGDKKTLAGIVNELIELFPDFTTEIRNAADEAGKTGNWEKFKTLLTDIADLQGTVLAQSANQAMVDAAGGKIGQNLKNQNAVYSTKYVGGMGTMYPTYDFEMDSFSSMLKRTINEKFGENAEMMTDIIFENIGKIFAISGGDLNKAGKQINDFLKWLGINLNETPYQIKGGNMMYDKSDDLAVLMHSNLGLTQADLKLIQQIKEASDNIKKANEVINGLNNKTSGNTTTTSITTSITESQVKLSGDTKIISEAVEEYTNTINELNNRLAKETISPEKYGKALDEVEDKTWEAITAVKDFAEILAKLGKSDIAEQIGQKYLGNRISEEANNAAQRGVNKGKQQEALDKYSTPTRTQRDKTSDYMYSNKRVEGEIFSELDEKIASDNLESAKEYERELEKMVANLQGAIENGDFNLIKDDALARLDELKTLLGEAKNEAETLQHALNFAEIEERIKELNEQLRNETIATIQDLSTAFDRLAQAVLEIGAVFDSDFKEKMEDNEIWSGIEKGITIINGLVQAYQTISTVINAIKAIEATRAALTEAEQQKEIANQSTLLGIQTALNIAKTQEAATSVVNAAAEKTAASAAVTRAGATVVAAAAGAGWPTMLAAIPASVAEAVAGISAIKAIGAFAEGGIVGGNSKNGDKILARVNSGELILNEKQQSTLWGMLNQKPKGIADVNFKLRGSELIGCISNYQSKREGR